MDEFKQEITIRSHFSHPHPLKLITYQETLNLSSSICSGCMLMLKPSSGMLYSCTICQDYLLHKKCFEMPKKMTHPFHKKHALTLMPKPAYGEVLFVCDACRQRGNGFSYHCKPCGFDLHMLCAIMPLSITHHSHIMHKLNLTCESNKKFSCDICMSLIGARRWLYRCKSCGFNAHLECVAPGDDPVVPTPSLSNAKERTPQEEASSFAPMAPNNVPPPLEVNRSQSNDLALFAVQQMIINNTNDITQAIHQMITNNTKAIAQAILSGGVGGGSGENRGLHLLIKLICTLNNSGVISGGGGHDSVNNGGDAGGGGSGGGGDTRENGGGGDTRENPGSRNNRLYRCNSCGVSPVLQQQKFMETPPPPPPPPPPSSPPQPQHQSFGPPPPCDDHMMNNVQIGFPAAGTQPLFGASRMTDGLGIQQVISNNNNNNNATRAQALLLSAYSGSRRGGVFGSYRPELHLQLMQLMSNGGIGGGGDHDSLLQALINGGGGDEILRSLLGDGNGY